MTRTEQNESDHKAAIAVMNRGTARVQFNRVSSAFDVVLESATLASYQSYTMALLRANYENGV